MQPPVIFMDVAIGQAIVKGRSRLDQLVGGDVTHPFFIEMEKQGEHIQGTIAGRVVVQVVVNQGAYVRLVIGIDHFENVFIGKGVNVGGNATGEINSGPFDNPVVTAQKCFEDGSDNGRVVGWNFRIKLHAKSVHYMIRGAFGASGTKFSNQVFYLQ